MMRFMAVTLCTLAAGAFFVLPAHSESNTIAPQNFVYAQSCHAPFAPPSAGFAIPGRRDLGALADVEQVWIDLSLFNNNFRPDTFIGAGPFTPRNGALEFQWDNLDQVQTHYYRLNALRDDVWIELGRGSFETINCGVVEYIECDIGHAAGTQRVQFGIAAAFSSPERPAIEQWFDITLFSNPRNPILDNGFPPGTFMGAGPFPREGTHFTWQGIRPGLRHHYRLNVLYAGMHPGWEQQYSGSFVSLNCGNLPGFDPPG